MKETTDAQGLDKERFSLLTSSLYASMEKVEDRSK